MTRAPKGRGASLTTLVNDVLEATGVSLRHNRVRKQLLRTPDVDFVSTGDQRRQGLVRTLSTYRAKSPGRMLVVISHDTTDNPEVHTDVRTLAFLLSEAVRGNEAHWARPVRAVKDTDEGETL